jgi:hypothetical protein
MPTRISCKGDNRENINKNDQNLVDLNGDKRVHFRKSDRIREKVDKNIKNEKKEIIKKEVKLCSKLSINWRNFDKTNNRSKALSHRVNSPKESVLPISSRIERVIPLEAQFIDHTNYTGKYRNMRPRYYLKVKKSPVHGFGLFALRAIPKETFLIEYIGND